MGQTLCLGKRFVNMLVFHVMICLYENNNVHVSFRDGFHDNVCLLIHLFLYEAGHNRPHIVFAHRFFRILVEQQEQLLVFSYSGWGGASPPPPHHNMSASGLH